MKTVSRIYFLIVVFVTMVSSARCGVRIDTVSLNYDNGIVEKKQIVVNYQLTNGSNEDYLTWVSLTPIGKKSDKELIYEFFKQRKGDFTWLQMMYEGLLETQPVNVGYSFVKNISPNGTFSYYVCKTDETSTFYEDRIVIIQREKVERYLREKIDDKCFFQLPYIVLTEGEADNGYAVPDRRPGG